MTKSKSTTSALKPVLLSLVLGGLATGAIFAFHAHVFSHLRAWLNTPTPFLPKAHLAWGAAIGTVAGMAALIAGGILITKERNLFNKKLFSS